VVSTIEPIEDFSGRLEQLAKSQLLSYEIDNSYGASQLNVSGVTRNIHLPK
jgi:hypothetical protein